jgi:hypothetical protein
MKYMVIIYGNKDLWQSFPPEVRLPARLRGRFTYPEPFDRT